MPANVKKDVSYADAYKRSQDEIRKVLKASTRGQRFRVAVHDEDYQNWSDRWQRERGGRSPSLGRPVPAGRRSPSKFGYLEESWRTRLLWSLRLRLRALREQLKVRAPWL